MLNTTFKKQVSAIALILGLTGCRVDDVFYSNIQRSDVYVQQYSDTKYDFLWVLDNSASMAPHRQFVKDNMQTFLNIMNSRKAVDFQMAVTTTDMFTDAGRLIPSAGGLKVVKSATSADPSAEFAAIIDGISDNPMTSFWEQGLESAYQAILNHQPEFSREGVPLIVILVTDEDDYSCQSHCFGPEPENNPDVVLFPASRYSSYFTNVKAMENTSTSIFPIIGMSSSTCTVASYGVRYETVQTAVGGTGVSGSICPAELRASYESIARVIADRGMVFQLTTLSSGTGVRVYVDGQLIPYSPDNYEFDETTNSIVFTGVVPRNGSVIEVSYSQKVN